MKLHSLSTRNGRCLREGRYKVGFVGLGIYIYMNSRRIPDSERRGFLGPELRQCCSPIWPVSVAPLHGLNLTPINRTETGGLNLMMPGSFQLSKPCVLKIATLFHSERTSGRVGVVSCNPTSLRLFRPDIFVPVINAHRPSPCRRCRQPGRIPTRSKSMFVSHCFYGCT